MRSTVTIHEIPTFVNQKIKPQKHAPKAAEHGFAVHRQTGRQQRAGQSGLRIQFIFFQSILLFATISSAFLKMEFSGT